MRQFFLFIFIGIWLGGCALGAPADVPMPPEPTLPPAAPTAVPLTPRPASTLPAPTATFTPVRTPTASPTLEPRPPANATALRLEIGAEYSPLYWLQVVSFPERYVGEKVVMEGFVLEVIDLYNFRIRLPDNAPAYVVSSVPLSGLAVGEKVSVYAVMQGRVCAYNGAIEAVCQILLSDARVGR